MDEEQRLLDEFARSAMHAILRSWPEANQESDNDTENVAYWSYLMAQAMMKERKEIMAERNEGE